MDRYENNPLLRLLDCYLMDLIGELGQDQLQTLVNLEPMLRRAWKSEGAWRQLVEEQMGFQPTVPDKVRTFWLGYIKAAKEQGLPAVPFDFVVSFVDQNFPHLVGGADVH
jgi:hypothetical protein